MVLNTNLWDGFNGSSMTAIKKLNVPAQIEVHDLSTDVQVGDLQAHFAKHGKVNRMIMDYQWDVKKLVCLLDYDQAESATAAIETENGQPLANDPTGPAMRVVKCDYVAIESIEPPHKKAKTSEWGTSDNDNAGDRDRWDKTKLENRSGGGGGRGRGCFKCGEEGHMSRECPKGGGGGRSAGGRGRGCFRCGEEGHMSRDCPKGGGKGCFKCGEEGHISRDCPKGGSRRGCFKCGQDGHMARDCTGDSNSGGGGGWGSGPSNNAAKSSEVSWGSDPAPAASGGGSTAAFDWGSIGGGGGQTEAKAADAGWD